MVIQTFCKAMVEHQVPKGTVINVGSIVGKNGNIGQSNYAASKAGVEVMTKTAAKELGREGIRVNAILPGFVTTPMTDLVPDKLKEVFASKIPLSRFGTPEGIIIHKYCNLSELRHKNHKVRLTLHVSHMSPFNLS